MDLIDHVYDALYYAQRGDISIFNKLRMRSDVRIKRVGQIYEISTLECIVHIHPVGCRMYMISNNGATEIRKSLTRK